MTAALPEVPEGMLVIAENMVSLVYSQLPAQYPKVPADVAAKIVQKSKDAMNGRIASLLEGTSFIGRLTNNRTILMGKAKIIQAAVKAARAEFEVEAKILRAIPVLKADEPTPAGLTTASAQKIIDVIAQPVLYKSIPDVPSTIVGPIVDAHLQRIEEALKKRGGDAADINSPEALKIMTEGFGALVKTLVDESEKQKAPSAAVQDKADEKAAVQPVAPAAPSDAAVDAQCNIQ